VYYCNAEGQCDAAYPVCDDAGGAGGASGSCETVNDCDVLLPPCACVEGWAECMTVDCIDGQCVTGTERLPCGTPAAECDDGTEVICNMIPPECEETFELLAVQDGCYVCVNPATCLPWGEPGCSESSECESGHCDPCGTSSCPVCDDCLGACVWLTL
jgi:hypothetical protein